MPTLTPIPTKYSGYSFRSRLEARWAVLFNALGIKFSYELEGYNLSGMYYLPDFYLIDLDCYVEIKGKKPTKREEVMAYYLSRDSGKIVHILSGSFPFANIDQWSRNDFMIYTYKYSEKPGRESIHYNRQFMDFLYLNDIYALNQCPVCKKINFCKNGMISELPCRCSRVKTNSMPRNIVRAFILARSASFEFKDKRG